MRAGAICRVGGTLHSSNVKNPSGYRFCRKIGLGAWTESESIFSSGLENGHRELEGRGVGNREVVVRGVVDRGVNQIKLPNVARWVEVGSRDV